MSKDVITYIPDGETKDEFALQRNNELARLFAELTGRTLLINGELSTVLPEGAVLFPHASITLEEAARLGVTSERQIFGAASEKLHSLKSIFHAPIPEYECLPDNFPFEFQRSAQLAGLVLPGFSCFTRGDVLRGFDLLDESGFTVRVKDPQGSFGMKQYIVKDRYELDEVLGGFDDAKLRQFGIVLEANLVHPETESTEPESYSAGWIIIDGQQYSYVGVQRIGDNPNVEHRYLGTKLYMVRGGVQNLIGRLDSPILDDVVGQLVGVADSIRMLPNLICSRYNFDFLRGRVQMKNGVLISKPVMAVTDQSFRVGGASIGELLGKRVLDENPERELVIASANIHYGDEEVAQMSDDAVVFYRGNDAKLGNVQVWGQVE